MKYYLLLDSSTCFLSVGLKQDNNLIDKIFYECFQHQSKYMVLEIKNILERNKIKINNINGIMVTIGPGSYFGIRVALTIAKIISLILNVPIYPISTLVACKVINNKSIVLFNARSDRSYIGVFDKDKCLLKDQVMYNNDVKKYIKNHSEFCLVGDLDYLNMKGKKIDILNNMNILFKKTKIKKIGLIKPIYLKKLY